jgi:hypothetical protein
MGDFKGWELIKDLVMRVLGLTCFMGLYDSPLLLCCAHGQWLQVMMRSLLCSLAACWTPSHHAHAGVCTLLQ